ncbi:MAG: tRNA (N(6)-L-threonylcarbamoyladenosine(37)-C(2))-methylthiotransferase MtaB [SAR324 cluster bacterium]|nr:tRNA (N(6)-L-threonylcarbamoyladenosine(37)-C(2))-methylthiotransferase MtaB [SAR324 cluster bacterium]
MQARSGNSSRRPKRAALHTLGCRLNQSESAALRRSLENAGYEIVPWGAEAELCVLNSCTVTARSDAKSRQALRSIRRRYPQARLALLGCYAQTQGEQVAGLGLADLILGNAQKMNLTGYLERGQAEAGGAPLVVTPRISRQPFVLDTFAAVDGKTRASLKIQDGCDFMCSFCIIPTARGRARVRRLANLMEEAHSLAEAGVREVVLTGVNLGTYQEDGVNLVDVVDGLNSIPGLARIRISSIEPTTVDEGLLERMADTAHRLVPYLHLPLQSGNDGILRAMRRRYGAVEYRRFAGDALRRVPHLCLGTDVMVGFPGEDGAAFQDTHDLLADLPLAYCHVFPYSERKGTPAARMLERVDAGIRQRRVALLLALSQEKQLAFQRRAQGGVRRVLFEQGKKAGMARGLTENFIRVEVPCTAPGALRNRILPVQLLRPGTEVMGGELVEPSPELVTDGTG